MRTAEQEMEWQNIEQIRDAIRQQGTTQEWADKPAERWGHVAVACHNEMYVCGGYNGKSSLTYEQ